MCTMCTEASVLVYSFLGGTELIANQWNMMISRCKPTKKGRKGLIIAPERCRKCIGTSGWAATYNKESSICSLRNFSTMKKWYLELYTASTMQQCQQNVISNICFVNNFSVNITILLLSYPCLWLALTFTSISVDICFRYQRFVGLHLHSNANRRHIGYQ